MTTTIEEIHAALRRLGVIASDATPPAEPLGGGVSSDIWRVDLPSRSLCIKRALARLKVQQEWHAPVERNAYEVAWLQTAAAIVPDAVPRIVAVDADAQLFVMEFLDPLRHRLWKSQLRDGVIEVATARAVGERLARIHEATADRSDIAMRFRSDAIFRSIRLEPYLAATARRHPGLAAALESLVARTARTRRALVHGDVSPKNILVGPSGPIFLDAECAWYGDPAFDLAFCLNHMLLKALWRPTSALAYLELFDALRAAYLAAVTWEDRQALEARIASLLPGLFLARVDGKSPVEYVTDERERDKVRRVATALIRTPPASLAAIRDAWSDEIRSWS
jgi:aminoglycoside phosphotransferase (APT) family kinase protein